jgi:hypothetical protein
VCIYKIIRWPTKSHLIQFFCKETYGATTTYFRIIVYSDSKLNIFDLFLFLIYLFSSSIVYLYSISSSFFFFFFFSLSKHCLLINISKENLRRLLIFARSDTEHSMYPSQLTALLVFSFVFCSIFFFPICLFCHVKVPKLFLIVWLLLINTS